MKKKLCLLLPLFFCLLFSTRSFADVVLTTEPVAASNITQGSLANLVYIVKVDVTITPVTINAIQFTLTGTHDANDLVNVRIYTNTTPTFATSTLRTTVSATFAAPHLYNLPLPSLTIAAGASLYYFIAVDVNASGTGGNTIKLDGAVNPVSFTYTTAPTITNNQTNVAGTQTIQAAGVTYSSEPVAALNITQGSFANLVYIVKVDVTSLPVTMNTIQCTLTGTHDANDLVNVRIYTNTTPTFATSTLRSTGAATFAAPHLYNLPLPSLTIAAGASLYYFIAVDVNASGTGGNTIKLDGAVNPVTFTYTTAPPITNNQTDVAGVQTILAPAITLSSQTIAASSIALGSINNIVYTVKADVTVLPLTITDIAFTLTGTHDANDLTNVKIYSNATPTLSGASNLGSFAATFAAPHTYNLNIADVTIAAGATRYFLITVDVDAAATNANTVKLDGLANPVSFSYTSGPILTNNQTDAAGIKTITLAWVWNGSVSDVWSNPANWDNGSVPGTTSNVVIPSGLPTYPVVYANTEIRKLDLQTGSSVTVFTNIILLLNGQ